ncbi:DUF3467 domain-containing protein [Candidatus Woesearchaeota archaeon]|jgi:hypothetical protein|nr:DUF3467 domain-containing protein [Candidatus Woesearchaeota archaeon]
MEQKNVKISVSEGTDFFCHEISINFNPMQFILDFKNITPRVDIRNKEGPTLVLRHNVVMLDPFNAKQMLNVLQNAIEKYETEFGEIKKPKMIKKAETKMKKKAKTAKSKKTNTTEPNSPNYFG